MQKLLTPEIAKKYINTEIEAEDIYEIVQFLSPTELYRLKQYEDKMWQNLTKKRLFLFICNLIDFSLKSNKKK